jgi:hypothetical protein
LLRIEALEPDDRQTVRGCPGREGRGIKRPQLPVRRCDFCDNGIEFEWDFCAGCGARQNWKGAESMSKDRDYIGPDPLAWVERLGEVNRGSQHPQDDPVVVETWL